MKKIILVALMAVVILTGSLAQAATSSDRFAAGVFTGSVLTFAAGDTVWGICAELCTPASLNMEIIHSQILEKNKIADARKIKIGQQVFFPATLLKNQAQAPQSHAALSIGRAELHREAGGLLLANSINLAPSQKVLPSESSTQIHRRQAAQIFAGVIIVVLGILWFGLILEWRKVKAARTSPDKESAPAVLNNFAESMITNQPPAVCEVADSLIEMKKEIAQLQKMTKIIEEKQILYEQVIALVQEYMAANNNTLSHAPPVMEEMMNVRELKAVI